MVLTGGEQKGDRKNIYFLSYYYHSEWVTPVKKLIEMVFCYQNYCEKKLFYWSRLTFEIRGWRPRIWNIFEIIRTICSDRERSEQFLATFSWRFLISYKLRPIRIQIRKKLLGFRNMQEKLEENHCCEKKIKDD